VNEGVLSRRLLVRFLDPHIDEIILDHTYEERRFKVLVTTCSSATPGNVQTYYHRSSVLLDVGTTLQPTGVPQNIAAIEAEFEARRPPQCIGRRAAIFMTDAPERGRDGVYGQYVYRVEPTGPVERYDSGWYGLVQKAHLKRKYAGRPGIAAYPDWTEKLLADCADAYWAGRTSPMPNWEFLTSGARVAEVWDHP
jgi:hypothetical protein